jgi:hypothetical protein
MFESDLPPVNCLGARRSGTKKNQAGTDMLGPVPVESRATRTPLEEITQATPPDMR